MIKQPMRALLTSLRVLGVVALAMASAGRSLAQTPMPQPAPGPQPMPLLSIRLSAAVSASSYNLGDPVAITWTLTNQSATSAGLSALADGNLVVTAFTRNGSPLPVMRTEKSYGDGFQAALATSLTAVAPGGSLSSLWTSDFNQEVGGEALLSVTYSGADTGSGSYYSLAAPGTYSLTFYYHYRGPTSTFPGAVFLGRTNSVTVTFTVL